MRKLFKKSIACCLVLALSLCLFAGAISANALTTNPSYSTEAVTVAPGESTTIKFTVSDFSEIQGVILKVYVPAVVASINSVTADNFTMVEWDDEAGAGNYQIGSDATGKFVKFMELANFTGVDTVAGFTFDINVTVAADAAEGPAAFPAPVIQATDGESLVTINGEFDEFVVVENEPEVPELNVTFDNTAKSLILEGLLRMNLTFTFVSDASNPTASNLDPADVIANAGVLVWSAADYTGDPATAILGTESYAKNNWVQADDYAGLHEYKVQTNGIAAKEYGDAVYYRPYYIYNGEYQYGDVYEYSVLTYCEGRFNKSNNEKLKQMLVALLNYGAAAQNYFSYKTNALVNADLESYVELYNLKEEYLNVEWDDAFVTPLVQPTDDMLVNFAKDAEAAITAKSLLLEGELSINFTHWADESIVNDIVSKEIYVWAGRDYNALKAAGTPLTRENATHTAVAEKPFAVDPKYPQYGWEAKEASMGIPTKLLGDTVYCAFVYTTSDGTEYCTGVTTYGPYAYCSSKLNNANANLVALCKAIVLYGKFAKVYFPA